MYICFSVTSVHKMYSNATLAPKRAETSHGNNGLYGQIFLSLSCKLFFTSIKFPSWKVHSAKQCLLGPFNKPRSASGQFNLRKG